MCEATVTKTQTPRIRLSKESDDEKVDQFADNWSILDSRAGELIVADGTTPADSALFDGQVVREATTGISWIAMKKPDGTFTKKYLTYPWQACANTTASIGSTTPGSYTHFGLDNWVSSFQVNSDSTALSGSQIQLPIAGLYTITLHARWPDPDSSDSYRSAAIRLNNFAIANWNEDIQHTNTNVVDNVCTQEYFAREPLEFIGVLLWQNSGGPKDCSFTLTVELVTPL
jgi:hypothetical protein